MGHQNQKADQMRWDAMVILVHTQHRRCVLVPVAADVDGGSVSPSQLGAIYERARFRALNSSKSERGGARGGSSSACGDCLDAVSPPSFIPHFVSAVARHSQEASRVFLFYLEQGAVLQARFRSKRSRAGPVVLTFPAESTLKSMRRLLSPPTVLPDAIVRLWNSISLAKRTRCTHVQGNTGDAQGSVNLRAVAEYQAITLPRMRVGHFNIAGVAWSNFKPGINANGNIPI